jgi:hypothetical protein
VPKSQDELRAAAVASNATPPSHGTSPGDNATQPANGTVNAQPANTQGNPPQQSKAPWASDVIAQTGPPQTGTTKDIYLQHALTNQAFQALPGVDPTWGGLGVRPELGPNVMALVDQRVSELERGADKRFQAPAAALGQAISEIVTPNLSVLKQNIDSRGFLSDPKKYAPVADFPTQNAPAPVQTGPGTANAAPPPPNPPPATETGSNRSLIPVQKRVPGQLVVNGPNGPMLMTGSSFNDIRSWRPASTSEVERARQTGFLYQ